jgi:cation-transporting ATPase 13A1
MLLFMLDDYWYFSLFTLFLLLVVERITVMQRHACLQELATMRQEPYMLPVYRCERHVPRPCPRCSGHTTGLRAPTATGNGSQLALPTSCQAI